MHDWLVAHYEVLKDFAGPSVTFLGFAATLVLGVTGFRRWRRQEVESRRIETAIEALSVAYESKYVFDTIRSPMSFDYEWEDMPPTPGETDEQRRQRGPFYVVGKRIRQHKDFFERVRPVVGRNFRGVAEPKKWWWNRLSKWIAHTGNSPHRTCNQTVMSGDASPAHSLFIGECGGVRSGSPSFVHAVSVGNPWLAAIRA